MWHRGKVMQIRPCSEGYMASFQIIANILYARDQGGNVTQGRGVHRMLHFTVPSMYFMADLESTDFRGSI